MYTIFVLVFFFLGACWGVFAARVLVPYRFRGRGFCDPDFALSALYFACLCLLINELVGSILSLLLGIFFAGAAFGASAHELRRLRGRKYPD